MEAKKAWRVRLGLLFVTVVLLGACAPKTLGKVLPENFTPPAATNTLDWSNMPPLELYYRLLAEARKFGCTSNVAEAVYDYTALKLYDQDGNPCAPATQTPTPFLQ